MSVVKHWHRLPSELADAPHLSVFKGHLDNVPMNILMVLVIPEVVRQLAFMIFEGPFQMNYLLLSSPLLSSSSLVSIYLFNILGMNYVGF